MSTAGTYDLPTGELGLTGPVVKPAPGTLPLRGDVAHIALATRYLVPHYVVPQIRTIAAGGAKLLLANNAEAAVVAELAEGSSFEALDFAGDWCWGCVSAEGPSGYVPIAALDPLDQ